MGRPAGAVGVPRLLDMDAYECVDFLLDREMAEVALEALLALDPIDRYFVLLGCLGTAWKRGAGSYEALRRLRAAALPGDSALVAGRNDAVAAVNNPATNAKER
jgi:hypothetical protein